MPKSQVNLRKFAARYFLGAVLLWIVLVATYAVWVFVVPHSFTFGPEIGPAASFVVFVILYSVPYVLVVLALFWLVALSSANGSGNNGA